MKNVLMMVAGGVAFWVVMPGATEILIGRWLFRKVRLRRLRTEIGEMASAARLDIRKIGTFRHYNIFGPIGSRRPAWTC